MYRFRKMRGVGIQSRAVIIRGRRKNGFLVFAGKETRGNSLRRNRYRQLDPVFARWSFYR